MDSSSSSSSSSSSKRRVGTISRHVTGGFVKSLLLHGPPAESATHSGNLVARTLQSHGVKFVFTLSGGHISPILVGCEDIGIRVIDVRHEVNAVFAADAVARLTGVPGVAAVTAGPGVTNTVTAIKNASMAQSPLVLLGGAAATMTKGRGALQDINQRDVLEPIVKECFTVTRVRDIVPALRKAFQSAASGTPGPVFVELPLDILYSYMLVAAGMGTYELTRAKNVVDDAAAQSRVVVPAEAKAEGLGNVSSYLASLVKKKDGGDTTVFLRPKESAAKAPFFARAYTSLMLRDVFAGAPSPSDLTDAYFAPLPVTFPMPKASDVATTAALLSSAQRPVIVIGSQATLVVPRIDELRRALEALGIPTFLGGMSRGLLGQYGPLHVRQGRGDALAKADVVVLLGAVADFRLSYGRALPRKAKIVAVNRDKASLYLNHGLFWSSAVAAQADPCEFMLAVAKSTKTNPSRFESWVASLKAKEAKKDAANLRKGGERAVGRDALAGETLVNPLSLLQSVEEALPEDSILVADGGDFVATASYIVRPRGPLCWLDPGAFGTLGVGGGFALGAKLARPESEVWLFWGDGSAGYSVAEFDAFARHGVPVIALVGNDACWTQIEREQLPMFGSSVACPIAYLEYDQVARGYGGEGLRLDDPSKDAAARVIAEARRIHAAGRPVLINALIGKTDFREGSISV